MYFTDALRSSRGKFMRDPARILVKKDELTLEIRLKTPYGPFPYIMTMPH